jgi:hypothetical protein
MISEIDIYRIANIYREQYGEIALIEAMKKIEEFRADNNVEGMEVWNKIANIIEWMQMPPELLDSTCH